MRQELADSKASFVCFISIILWCGMILGALLDPDHRDLPKRCEIVDTKPLVVENLDALTVYPTYELKCDEFADPAYEWSK